MTEIERIDKALKYCREHESAIEMCIEKYCLPQCVRRVYEYDLACIRTALEALREKREREEERVKLEPLTMDQLDRLDDIDVVIEYVQDEVRLPARFCGVMTERSMDGKTWYIVQYGELTAYLLASQYGTHWVAYAVDEEPQA